MIEASSSGSSIDPSCSPFITVTITEPPAVSHAALHYYQNTLIHMAGCLAADNQYQVLFSVEVSR